MRMVVSYWMLSLDWPWLSYSKEYLLLLPPPNYPSIGGMLYNPVSAAAYIDFQYHAKTLIPVYHRHHSIYLFTYCLVKPTS